jgi:hypothetical protein
VEGVAQELLGVQVVVQLLDKVMQEAQGLLLHEPEVEVVQVVQVVQDLLKIQDSVAMVA